MIIRWAKESDVAIVQEWWAKRLKHPPPAIYIYPMMAIAEWQGEHLAAIALHMDRNGHVAFLAYVSANPDIKQDTRDAALNKLVEFLEGYAKGQGFKYLGCFTDTRPVGARLKQHGFTECEPNMTLFMKAV